MSVKQILLVDDHELFRKGIASLLKQSDETTLVLEAANGAEALYLAEAKNPQLVILDINLPDLNGIEVCRRLRHTHPSTAILAISHASDEPTILRMLEAGAHGYLLKDGSVEELWLAIRILGNGDSYFSKEVSAMLLSGIQKKKRTVRKAAGNDIKQLTNREMEILQYVAEEFSNKEIADRLFISPRTVETHKRNLIQKLKVRNTVGLVKYYLHRGAFKKEQSA